MTRHPPAPATAGPGWRWARRMVAAGLLALTAGLLAAPAAHAVIGRPAGADPVVEPTTSPTPAPPEIVLVPGGPPTPTAPADVPPRPDTPPAEDDPHWWDLGGRVRKAITDWLSEVVTTGIRSTTGLLAGLLYTPDPRSDPRVRQLWTTSLVIADTAYLLLVLAGAVVLASYETLQTRYTAAQIAPRLVVGMVAAHASLALSGELVSLGNALAGAFLADRVDPAQVSIRLRDTLQSWLAGANSAFLVLLGLVALVLIVAVGFTVIVRHALVLLLTAAAPLALACHALPHTEAAARLWWRSLCGLLLAQAGQALALVTLERVVLTSGQRLIPSGGIASDLLIVIGLLYVMLRIPGWAARAAFGGSGGLNPARLVTYAVIHRTVRTATGMPARIVHTHHGSRATGTPARTPMHAHDTGRAVGDSVAAGRAGRPRRPAARPSEGGSR